MFVGQTPIAPAIEAGESVCIRAHFELNDFRESALFLAVRTGLSVVAYALETRRRVAAVVTKRLVKRHAARPAWRSMGADVSDTRNG
jgi:predicted kinase